MVNAYRRVILKPPALSEADRAQLTQKLGDAVAWQQELSAKSPHVLQFLGGLEETESTFFVEHEPAGAILPTATLFDASPPPLDQKQLLRMTVALFDALRAAHGTQGRRLKAHGGLCPGVLLTSPDGIEKLTDFGFAPALCAGLGVEKYLNLAVSAPLDPTPETQGTGVWMALSPDNYDRDDRICSFIDPEKYGTGTQETFEPGSDVIAAGFILHLMAEHRHPYLPDAEAHRMVEMSEFMAMARYNGARRKELRESPEPTVVLWCKLVGEMLARLPQNRPTAQGVNDALSQYVKPVDAGEILRRRLEAATDLVDEGKWQELRTSVKAIADSDVAPADVLERANALLREADAHILLERAVDVLKVENWQDAKEPLDGILALPALPEDVTGRAKKASAVLEYNLALQRGLDEIRAHLEQDDRTDLAAAHSLLEESVAKLDEAQADRSALPVLQSRAAKLREEVAGRLEQVSAEIERIEAKRRAEADRLERERKADWDRAERWFTDLQSALEQEAWETVSDVLSRRPELKHWPEGAETRIADFDRRLKEHLAEQERRARVQADHNAAGNWIQRAREAIEAEAWDQAEKVLGDRPQLTHWPKEVLAEALTLTDKVAEQRRLAAIEADRQAATAWIRRVREAVEAEAWDQAEQALADRPQLTHWPDDVLADAKALSGHVKNIRQQQADLEQAKAWCAELRRAVEAEQWNKAADVISQRPVLEHWPEEVTEEESLYRAEVEKQLEAIELRRRQIAAWTRAANEASEAGRWDEALRILDAPPVGLDDLPDEVRQRAGTLRQSCLARREEELAQRREERTKAVHAAACEFVLHVVAERLHAFVTPSGVRTIVEAVQFADSQALDEGTARLSVTVGDGADSGRDRQDPHEFAFRVDGDALRIIDDDGSLRAGLTSELSKSLLKLQKARLAELVTPLRKGAFAKTQVAVKLGELSERVEVTFCLLGSAVPEGKVPSELVWDSSALAWAHGDAAGFTQRALDLGARQTRAVMEAKLLQESDQLRRYGSALSLEVVPGALADAGAVPGSLPLEGRLMIDPGGQDKPKPLHTFTATCSQVGQAPADTDTAGAVAKLEEMVVAVQNASRDGLRVELQRRIDAAPMKVKLKVFPKRISDPIDEVRFEVVTKSREPVMLEAAWDVNRFAYSASNGWQSALDRALAPPAPGEKRSRGFMPVIGVAVAVLAVIAGTAYVLQRGDQADPTGPLVERAENVNDNLDGQPDHIEEDVSPNGSETETDTIDVYANANEAALDANEAPADSPEAPVNANADDSTQNDNESPPSVPIPSTDDALANLNEILERCLPLRPYLDKLIVGPEDEGSPVLTYRLVGFENAEQTVGLELTEDGAAWRLSRQDRQNIESRVTYLNKLLRLEHEDAIGGLNRVIVDSVARAPWARFLNTADLTFQPESAPQWELAETQDRWTAHRVVGKILLAAAGVELADIETDLELENGAVRFSDVAGDRDPLEGLTERVEAGLLQQQVDSARLRYDELQRAIGSIADVSGPSASLAQPRETIELAVEAPGLQRRAFTATWDPEELAFVFDEADGKVWTARADELVLAHDVLDGLNSRPGARDDWLGRGSTGPVVELAEPDEDGIWKLAVAPPWVKPEEVADLALKDYLPIDVPVDSLGGRDAAVLAESIVQDARQPRYWPLIDRYLTYTADPSRAFFLEGSDRESLLTAIEDVVGSTDSGRIALEHLRANPSYCRVRMEVAGKPTLVSGAEDGAPEELRVPLSGGWELAEAPEGVAAGVLRSAIRELMQPVDCSVTLSISDSGDVVPSWSDVGALLGGLETPAPSVAELERQLAHLPARVALERQLQNVLGGREQVDLGGREDEVFGLLTEIWRIKGATARRVTGFEQLLRNQRAGMTFSKSRKLKPTIFAEYFCGAESCYAIVYSTAVRGTSVEEGPILHRLCRIDRLSGPDGTDPGSRLGQDLIGAVLEAVPEAKKADVLSPFEGMLGVVVAPDEAMSMVRIHELEFEPAQVFLSLIDPASGMLPNARFDSLSALRDDTKGLMCDYRLVAALGSPRSRWQPTGGEPELEAKRWASAILAAACQPTE